VDLMSLDPSNHKIGRHYWMPRFRGALQAKSGRAIESI
jgi:hypothetical protein